MKLFKSISNRIEYYHSHLGRTATRCESCHLRKQRVKNAKVGRRGRWRFRHSLPSLFHFLAQSPLQWRRRKRLQTPHTLIPTAGPYSPAPRSAVGIAWTELRTARASSMCLIVTEMTATMDCPLLEIQEVVGLA